MTLLNENQSQTLYYLLILVSLTFAKQQTITEGPESQQARIGDQVILKCKIENLAGEPQWCIDDFCLGFSRKNLAQEAPGEPQLTLKGRPRHKIIGDRSKGEYHLLIEPVQLQDNMFFYCMATAAVVNIKAVKSERVFLTVLTNPQSLNLASPVDVSLNKPSSVQCIARQSRPPVKILIAINGKLVTDESKYTTDIIQKPINGINGYAQKKISSASEIRLEDMRQSFYDTITNLTVTDVSMDMQGQLVECFVYSFLNSGKTDSTYAKPVIDLDSFQNNVMNIKSHIQVNYAPEVSLKMTSSNQILKEEDVISLACHTRATPEIQSYKWYIGENFLPGVGGANLNLKLRKEMHLKTITCEATNTVASVKASIQLNILFKPAFIHGSRSFMLIDKNGCNLPLTLDCQVDANPGANITWYRRRLNQNLYRYVTKDERAYNQRMDYSKLKTLSINDHYYDELIGTGPTYTIASFNCANKLVDLKNQSTHMQQTSDRKKRNLSPLPSNSNQDESKSFFEDLKLPDSNYYEGAYDDYMNFDYEYDNEDDEYQTKTQQIDIDFKQSKETMNEFDDFGIYICEAKNILTLGNQRFIKINPAGAPILHVLASQTSTDNLDEMVTSIMAPKDSETDPTELASSIGESISLICLIEPLPEVQSIVWIKDNGKIIPHSKYSSGKSESFSVTKETSTKKPMLKKKSMRNNFRIKYENLTLSDNLTNPEESDELEVGVGLNGVKTTRSHAGLMRSVLYIKDVRYQDLGVYKCKAINQYGSRVASVVVREKTLMDKINMNNYMVFTTTVTAMVFFFALLVLVFMCIVSKKTRDAFCCCYTYTDRIAKEKELLSQNSNCEQTSDKTINEWLASSKLSNDTAGTNSLINQINNTSTTTTATILNGIEHSCLNIHNTLTKNSKASRLIGTHTPIQMRRDLAAGNCSSLLNDEIEDDPNSSNETLEQSRRRNIGLLSEPIDFNLSNNTFSKRDELRMNTNNYYQSSQFNRFLVSSPLLSTSSSQKDSSIDETSNDTRSELLSSMGTTNISKQMNLPPMMTIRSQNMPNGNFNAKISSTGFSSSTMNQPKNQRPQFNTFTLNRNENRPEMNKVDVSMYENSTKNGSNSDLTKMLQDTTFRLSDLFNELTPHLNGNSVPNNNRSYQTTLPKNPNPSGLSVLQQFPSPKHQMVHSENSGSRQNLLQQPNSSFNKFPNPFNGCSTIGNAKPANNTKFYTNLYRANSRQANENYNFNDTSSSSNSTASSTDVIKQLIATPNQNNDKKLSENNFNNNSPIAKIITSSTENGNTKYQTVV